MDLYQALGEQGRIALAAYIADRVELLRKDLERPIPEMDTWRIRGQLRELRVMASDLGPPATVGEPPTEQASKEW